jgi:hypothetical protein
MTAAAVAHVIVSDLATGSIYALVTLSLVIVYRSQRDCASLRPRGPKVQYRPL